LPIPLGLPLLVLAGAMLAVLFPAVQHFLERFSRRHPRNFSWLGRIMQKIDREKKKRQGTRIL
jgi:hypothetical protein